ncbi:MAG: heparinase II/III family protein, partial [Fimbriimonadaceae bacterium]|nr:heparinase II/III family protein [Alphaproteobacteria bacterium]
VLAYDDTFGKPIGNATHSGYQRLQAEHSVVIVDAGGPPPPIVSSRAHAGCLSFEISSGIDRIITNCGRPLIDNADWQRAARTTAAHSTVSIEDTSSCVFSENERLQRLAGTLIIDGPRHVAVQRTEKDDEIMLDMSHDGYNAQFGTVHERLMSLSKSGKTLKGRENFISGRSKQNPSFAVRFHIHPDVKIAPVQNGAAMLLTLPHGEIWAFTSEGAEITLEESVFLSGPHGARPSNQIVLYGRTAHQKSVAWVLHCVGDGKAKPSNNEAPGNS